MVLEFPVRASTHLGEAERLRQLRLPIAVRRRLPVLYWAQRNRRILTVGFLVFAVLGFSGAWTGGALVLDGPGVSLYVRLALDHLGADRAVPYWLPDLWAGAPVWVVMPTLPLFLLVPLATAMGPEVAVKVGVLGFQVFGACGTYLLARSLWRNYSAAVVAGLLFALQPLVVSHGALAGSPSAVGVMAVAPWLVWSLRRGLRGDGPGFLAGAGLLGGFAVLLQPGFAIGLVLAGACLLLVEVRRTGNPAGPGRLLARAGAVVAVGLGTAAYWLLPFADMGTSFMRSRPELLPGDLFTGTGDRTGPDLGAFFGRAGELTGAVGVDRDGLLPLFFHLGWVGLALTLVSVVFLAGRNRDGTLTAILLSAALGVWLSAGAVPLASSGPAARSQVVAFVVAGAAAGLLLGALLRRLRPGRRAPIVLGGMVAFLAALPYLTPFDTLGDIVPLLGSLRAPRLYAVAPLALALGAAFTVVLVEEWAERRRARSAPAALPSVLAGAVALAVLGMFLVDVWPSRSYYRVRPPATAAAYREVVANLAPRPGDFRIAPASAEPVAVDSLLDTGRAVSVGWPHAAAGTQVWRLTGEPLLAPGIYRDRALGLSATPYLVTERPTDRGTASEAVPAIDLAESPGALAMVRAYNRTVAVAGRDITPELAVALAYRNIGVFTGSPAAGSALAATTVVEVDSTVPCADDSGARLDPGVASLLGVACGLHTWLGTLSAGVELVDIGQGAGAVFRSTTDGLRGISAYLDRVPDRAEVALYEVLPGGGSLGPELARGKAVGTDENGMAAFTFDPVAGAAGKEFAFLFSCPGCSGDGVPRLVAGHSLDGSGNLLLADGAQRRDRAAAFAPLFAPVNTDPPPTTTVEPTRAGPGRWRIRANGTQPALVVVAEAWFPGWKARVDGREVAVVEADGGFLGVPVDSGDHLVILDYRRPAAATTGRVLTAATLLTLAGLALRRRHRGAPGLRSPTAGGPATARGRQAAPARHPGPAGGLRASRPPSPPRRRRPASLPAAPPSPPGRRGEPPGPPPARRPAAGVRRRVGPPRRPTPPPAAGQPDWDAVVQRPPPAPPSEPD